MPRNTIHSSGLNEALVASGARTVSGDSGVVRGFGYTSKIRAQLNVTAFGGTNPTLDVVIEDTLDGTNWNVIGTFAQRVGVGRQVIDITSPYSDEVRARWTIGGTTPSFTFALDIYTE